MTLGERLAIAKKKGEKMTYLSDTSSDRFVQTLDVLAHICFDLGDKDKVIIPDTDEADEWFKGYGIDLFREQLTALQLMTRLRKVQKGQR